MTTTSMPSRAMSHSPRPSSSTSRPRRWLQNVLHPRQSGWLSRSPSPAPVKSRASSPSPSIPSSAAGPSVSSMAPPAPPDMMPSEPPTEIALIAPSPPSSASVTVPQEPGPHSSYSTTRTSLSPASPSSVSLGPPTVTVSAPPSASLAVSPADPSNHPSASSSAISPTPSSNPPIALAPPPPAIPVITLSTPSISASATSKPLPDIPAPSSAPLQKPAAPIDPLVALWNEAIVRYTAETGVDLNADGIALFESEDAIHRYLDEHEKEFDKFRDGGAKRLRDALTSVVAALGPLCAIVGDGVGMAFEPSKVIFGAVGELCKAAVEVGDELGAITDAFDAMAHHLRIVERIAGRDVLNDYALREASVKLLAQILVVLAVIQKVRRQGHLVLWLKKLAKSKEVASALADLSRLAGNHHETVTAVTLHTAKKTMTILTEIDAWSKEEQVLTRASLACITKTAQDIYARLCRNDTLTVDQQNTSRGTLENIQMALLRQIDLIKLDRKTADLEGIFAWLQFPDSSVKMNNLLDNRAQSTGSWFLDSEEFTASKQRTTKTLLLHGKAGCGKSTMIAAVIRDLQADAASSDAESITLSHLFDTTGSSPRNLRAFLSSLLCQLAYHLPECASRLLKAREDVSGRAQLSLDMMRYNLDAVIRATQMHLFVVIDALDEADDPKTAVLFLKHLRTYDNVSLIVSSRMEVAFRTDLEALCDTRVAMDVKRVTGDITIVLATYLAPNGLLGDVSNKSLVSDKLREGADGNFRWTVLLARELVDVAGIPFELLRRLEESPRTLASLYDDILARIYKTGAQKSVRNLLVWAVLAVKPLTTAEFAHLMSFDYSYRMPVYDAALNSSADHVVALAGSNFVAVRDGEVRIVHASVKDHLLNPPEDSLELNATKFFHIDTSAAYASMTRTCLAYIRANTDLRSQKHVHHLIWTWVFYFVKVDLARDPDLEQDVIDTLANIDRKDVVTVSLYPAIQTGSTFLATLLIDRLGADVEGKANSLRAPRITSMTFDGQFEAMAPILVDSHFVDDDESQRRCTPLHCAAYHKQVEIVRLLIDKGANIEAQDEAGWTPLRFAASNRHLEIARLFVEHGANVTAVLHIAAQDGNLELARLLLDHRADVEARRKGFLGRRPLHLAAENGHLEVAQYLIYRGADVDALCNLQMTALHYAVTPGHLEIAELLLDHGADVHVRAKDCQNATPLHAAAMNGHLEVARLLIDRGAIVGARQSNKEMPIHLATMNGHLEVARLLIDHGADVDASDEDGRTPLHGAAGNCEEQTIRLLIDLCCDVNAQSRNGETPLDAVGSDFFASDDLALRERIRQMLRQAGATESSARRAATDIESDTGGERVGYGDRFV